MISVFFFPFFSFLYCVLPPPEVGTFNSGIDPLAEGQDTACQIGSEISNYATCERKHDVQTNQWSK